MSTSYTDQMMMLKMAGRIVPDDVLCGALEEQKGARQMSYTMGSTAYPSYRAMLVGQLGEYMTGGGNNGLEESVLYLEEFVATPDAEWAGPISEWFAGYNSENPQEPVTLQDLLDAASDVRQWLLDEIASEAEEA